MANSSFFVQNEHVRPVVNVPVGENGPIAVIPNRWPSELVFFDAGCGLFAFVIAIHANIGERLSGQGREKFLMLTEYFSDGLRPEHDHHYLPTQVAEPDVVAVEVLAFEFRRGLAE